MTEPRIDPDRSKGWVRRMLPLVLAHRRLVLLSLSAALVAQLLLVSAPRMLMAAIDDALVRQTSPVEVFAVALVLIAAARFAANTLHRRCLHATSAHLEHDLRSLVQGSLSGQTFSWYDDNSTGALMSRANSDIRTSGDCAAPGSGRRSRWPPVVRRRRPPG